MRAVAPCSLNPLPPPGGCSCVLLSDGSWSGLIPRQLCAPCIAQNKPSGRAQTCPHSPDLLLPDPTELLGDAALALQSCRSKPGEMQRRAALRARRKQTQQSPINYCILFCNIGQIKRLRAPRLCVLWRGESFSSCASAKHLSALPLAPRSPSDGFCPTPGIPRAGAAVAHGRVMLPVLSCPSTNPCSLHPSVLLPPSPQHQSPLPASYGAVPRPLHQPLP